MLGFALTGSPQPTAPLPLTLYPPPTGFLVIIVASLATVPRGNNHDLRKQSFPGRVPKQELGHQRNLRNRKNTHGAFDCLYQPRVPHSMPFLFGLRILARHGKQGHGHPRALPTHP
uniref:Uncharacterized protein n=1 Tax=Candidatus Kentrum sp. FW TaxID=2126338 RepID=A0A450SAY4_9GAMM|nr:MAG: hypothetical protein BECKFW1821A_GA0114235_102242 [Candidatus Kentron sp. FW]